MRIFGLTKKKSSLERRHELISQIRQIEVELGFIMGKTIRLKHVKPPTKPRNDSDNPMLVWEKN